LREKRFDKYRIHSGGIFFRLKGNIGAGIIASKWTRDSNLEWERDKRIAISGSLTHTF